MKYILGIDQSTQGTKAILVDEYGQMVAKADKAHAQLINDAGWISHSLEEIYENVLVVAKQVIQNAGIDKADVIALGISNQRETTALWNRKTGKPLADAIVWQCARAKEICERENIRKYAEKIKDSTGMNLSPYFPASKLAWLLENVEEAKRKSLQHEIGHGTMDSWLLYKLTNGKAYKTDYSNASRTQLFNINTLTWDEDICELFAIDMENLPEVCDSNGDYGTTDLEGFLRKPIPIHCVMGDSHGALFAQGCIKSGMIKATYGTGSSIMMNIGSEPIKSQSGVVTSLAWSIDGVVNYVLEGNLNYTGAVITWLKEDMELISLLSEVEPLARCAMKEDELYLVPAFSGLGAPYWDSDAKAAIVGMTRRTRRAELVRATVESIAYQITDIVKAMSHDSKITVSELRVDGGPTDNGYLMQFQSDILNANIQVPNIKELSAMGVSYVAGMAVGVFDEDIFHKLKRTGYIPGMSENNRNKKYDGWKCAVNKVLSDTAKE